MPSNSTSDSRNADIESRVSFTALLAAAGRAVENFREDALICDPLADIFVQVAYAQLSTSQELFDVSRMFMTSPSLEGVSSFKHAASEIPRSPLPGVGVRSYVFDDYLMKATAEDVRQVVLLAAGLDARAFRLDWESNCTLFEIDKPEVLDFKDQVISDHDFSTGCVRKVIAHDLRENWPKALIKSGFDRSQPTAWLAEGLVMYLPPNDQRNLLERIHELSAVGSRIGLDYIPRPHDFEEAKNQMNDVHRTQKNTDWNSPFFPKIQDNPGKYLENRGWQICTRDILNYHEMLLKDPIANASSFFNIYFLQTGRLFGAS